MQNKHVQSVRDTQGQSLFTANLTQAKLKNAPVYNLNQRALVGKSNAFHANMNAATVVGINTEANYHTLYDHNQSIKPIDSPIFQTPTGLQNTYLAMGYRMIQRSQGIKRTTQPNMTISNARVQQNQIPYIPKSDKIRQDVNVRLQSHQRMRIQKRRSQVKMSISSNTKQDQQLNIDDKLYDNLTDDPKITFSTDQKNLVQMENYMEQSVVENEIQHYFKARYATKASLLDKMVRAAWAAGALATFTTLLPYPIGALDMQQNPDMRLLDYQGLQYFLPHQFPSINEFLSTYWRNAILSCAFFFNSIIAQYNFGLIDNEKKVNLQ